MARYCKHCGPASTYVLAGNSGSIDQECLAILVSIGMMCAVQVTHLGYYETEEEAARVYDRVSISLHGAHAQTNYPVAEYEGQDCGEFQGLAREELQRALGVKPMDKSSQ